MAEKKPLKLYPKLYLEIAVHHDQTYEIRHGLENMNHPLVMQAMYMAIIEGIGDSMIDNYNQLYDQHQELNEKAELTQKENDQLDMMLSSLEQTFPMIESFKKYLKLSQPIFHQSLIATAAGVASGTIKPYSKDFIDSKTITLPGIDNILNLQGK